VITSLNPLFKGQAGWFRRMMPDSIVAGLFK